MIGIVVVSHSRALAEAARDLAVEMVPAEQPELAIAAGVDGGFGTDAVAVSEAIEEVRTADGVLVFCDLGSAVLSAELALEFVDAEGVLVTPAPLVEGLVVAVVRAAAGASLAEVAREAVAALDAKRSALGVDVPEPASADVPTGPADAEAEVTLVNPGGLHARPAGRVAALLAGLNADVRVEHAGRTADGASPTALLGLAAAQDDRIVLSAWGPDARRAIDRVTAEAAAGFGELDAGQGPASDPGAGLAGLTGLAVRPPDPPVPPAERSEPAPADPEREAARVDEALAAVADDLRRRAVEASGAGAEILRAAAAMAGDPQLARSARQRIQVDRVGAARAVWLATGEIAESLAGAGGRAAERAVDLRDVRDRALAWLAGSPRPPLDLPEESFVLVGRELAPADVVAAVASGRCLGIATEAATPTSHAAIIARDAGLVALTGVVGAGAIPAGVRITAGPDGVSVAAR